ncbi:MAG TPA: diacylglycerol kinase family protein [Parvularculaceae bacterium]|nr:diacylglycerol kinase family protein [Parvularculaceae bacterium]
MSAVGLIINERSSRARSVLGDLLHVARQFPNVRPAVLNGVDGLDRALAEMNKARVDTVMMAGGDGTIQAAFTDAINMRRFEHTPRYVAVPCGMTNVIAADCGLKGSPVDALDQFLWRRKNGDVRRIRRSLMGLRIGARNAPVYGFFLGAGAFTSAVRYSRTEVQSIGAKRSMAMALTIGGAILKSAFGEKPTEPPLVAEFRSPDNNLVGPQPMTMALMTTLQRLVLGVNPFWGEGAGALAVTTIGFPAQKLLGAAPSVLRGKSEPWFADAGYRSWRTEALEAEFEGTVVFDGEFFDVRRSEQVAIETTHDAEFLN